MPIDRKDVCHRQVSVLIVRSVRHSDSFKATRKRNDHEIVECIDCGFRFGWVVFSGFSIECKRERIVAKTGKGIFYFGWANKVVSFKGNYRLLSFVGFVCLFRLFDRLIIVSIENYLSFVWSSFRRCRKRVLIGFFSKMG